MVVHRLFHFTIEAAAFFLLACRGETANALHISDDAGEVVYIVAATFGAFLQVAFVDMTAFVADSVGNVEGKVIATFGSCNAQELAVLLLGEVLFEVHVKSRTASEVADIMTAMETELVNNV